MLVRTYKYILCISSINRWPGVVWVVCSEDEAAGSGLTALCVCVWEREGESEREQGKEGSMRRRVGGKVWGIKWWWEKGNGKVTIWTNIIFHYKMQQHITLTFPVNIHYNNFHCVKLGGGSCVCMFEWEREGERE